MKRVVTGNAAAFLRVQESSSVQFCYIDPPFATQSVQRGSRGSYSDRYKLDDHKKMMERLLIKLYRVLDLDGSVMVHLDERTVHQTAVLMRDIFEVHINDIIWCYQSGGAGKRNLAKKHDTILWYAKSERYTFNVIREPYPRDYGDRPGFHPEGRMLNDWWTIPIMSTTSKERVGYPNQKPLALLERCISIATNPGDVVLDFFCGSGTTGVAAKRLGRKYLLCDKNPEATAIAKERLQNEQSNS